MAPSTPASAINIQCDSVGISDKGTTKTVDEEESFAGVRSLTSELTLAVLVMFPAESRRNVNAIVAVSPLVRVPRLHVTVVVPLQLP